MSLYRTIIRQSFIIAWKHKYLWVFGLFATLLASNFEIELINRFTNRQGATAYDWQRWAQTGIFSPRAWGNLIEMFKADAGSSISMIVILLALAALFIVLLWLSVVSQGGLVNNAQKALANGNRLPSAAERKHDTSTGFKEGRKHFWQIFGLNVIVRIIVYVLALVTIAPIFAPGNLTVLSSILYFVVFIILLAVALVLAFMTKYAIAYIVLKNQTMGQAIASGWRLFMKNWLVSLEMTFILFAVSILGSLAIILAVMIMAIPVALLYILGVVFGSFPIFLAVLILGVLVSIAIVVIGGSILTVIQTTAWVSLFTQLVGNKAPASKLERVFNNIM